MPVLSATELLLGRYREYLRVERGLAGGTARGYVDLVRPFVASRADERGELDLGGLTPSGVLASCWRSASGGRAARRN